jgi:hypothetical protein
MDCARPGGPAARQVAATSRRRARDSAERNGPRGYRQAMLASAESIRLLAEARTRKVINVSFESICNTACSERLASLKRFALCGVHSGGRGAQQLVSALDQVPDFIQAGLSRLRQTSGMPGAVLPSAARRLAACTLTKVLIASRNKSAASISGSAMSSRSNVFLTRAIQRPAIRAPAACPGCGLRTGC